MSAVASVTIGGTTVTGMPRLVASATSMLYGVIDCDAMARSFGLAAMIVAIDLVVQQGEQDVAFAHGRDQRLLADDAAGVAD